MFKTGRLKWTFLILIGIVTLTVIAAIFSQGVQAFSFFEIILIIWLLILQYLNFAFKLVLKSELQALSNKIEINYKFRLKNFLENGKTAVSHINKIKDLLETAHAKVKAGTMIEVTFEEIYSHLEKKYQEYKTHYSEYELFYIPFLGDENMTLINKLKTFLDQDSQSYSSIFRSTVNMQEKQIVVEDYSKKISFLIDDINQLKSKFIGNHIEQ